jgi:hypothetical protein
LVGNNERLRAVVGAHYDVVVGCDVAVVDTTPGGVEQIA